MVSPIGETLFFPIPAFLARISFVLPFSFGGSKFGTPVFPNDINVITAEINAYKQMAGEAIFEIGRRLKHVKENDLAHGQFGKWLESVGMNHRVANQMMKVAAELDDEKWRTSSNLGMEALYQIATMPEEQRYRPHTIPSTGEVKTVDEMTVRELREVKKALKEAQQAYEQLSNVTTSRHLPIGKIFEMLSLPPEIDPRVLEICKQVDFTRRGVRKTDTPGAISANMRSLHIDV